MLTGHDDAGVVERQGRHMSVNRVFVAVSLLASSPALIAEDDYVVETVGQHRAMFQSVTPENFDDGGKVSHYVWKYFPAFYNMMPIARTGDPRPLDENLRVDVASATLRITGEETAFDRYVNSSPHVDGVIALHEGEIVYEAYPNMAPWDRHYTWSVSKVVASTALAILEAEGRVNVDEPVETYLPELAGTAWEGTSVRNIANMASGIDCRDSDGYQNTEGCIYRFEESLNLTAQVRETLPSTLDVLKTMQRRRPQMN